MYLNFCWKISHIPARTKILLNKCWPNMLTSYSFDKKSFTTCVDQTYIMPCENSKCIYTCVNQPMQASTQNAYQLVLTKPKQCQPDHKMHLRMCWQNSSHGKEEKNAPQHGVDHSNPMPARTQNASQHMMFNPIPCQDTKIISTCVYEIYPMPAKTEKFISTCVDLNLPCQRGQKIHRNMCSTKPSNASEDTLYLNSCWLSPSHVWRTQNISQLVLTKPLPSEREHKIPINKPFVCKRDH